MQGHYTISSPAVLKKHKKLVNQLNMFAARIATEYSQNVRHI